MALLTKATSREPSAPASPRDADLARRVVAGPDGQTAFRLLYERYHDDLHAFLVRLVGDAARADDVLQEAFLKAYAAIDRYDPERSFRPWIYRIARNAALDALRVRKKEQRLEGRPLVRAVPRDDAEDPAAKLAARKEQVARLEVALERLPAESRALLTQRHGLCMKLSDLAASFDVTERTIRNRLRVAAAQLASALMGGDA